MVNYTPFVKKNTILLNKTQVYCFYIIKNTWIIIQVFLYLLIKNIKCNFNSMKGLEVFIELLLVDIILIFLILFKYS